MHASDYSNLLTDALILKSLPKCPRDRFLLCRILGGMLRLMNSKYFLFCPRMYILLEPGVK